jgi:hypothetical protein
MNPNAVKPLWTGSSRLAASLPQMSVSSTSRSTSAGV